MSPPLEQTLRAASLAEPDVVELARLCAAPPPGTIDGAELVDAPEARRALLAAIVAATDQRRFAAPLARLLAFVDARQHDLAPLDAGRYWHLRGVVAWRQDDALFPATRAFNRSIRVLRELGTPAATAYLARVCDSYGQLLHHQGLLEDARHDFEAALAYRRASGDRVGEAITLGNLGRLCIDYGDWEAAARYLGDDLALVEETTPEKTRLRSQLLNQLGTCALELGHLDEAERRYAASAAVAEASQDAVGQAFAALGLGRVALRAGSPADIEKARALAAEAAEHVSRSSAPPAFVDELRGRVRQLAADASLAGGDVVRAVEQFREAQRVMAGGAGSSPVDHAWALYGLARALLERGEDREAALCLREALRDLDATAAEQLRAKIEGELRSRFPDSWLLHAAGRFVGQKQIEFLLAEAGRGGFRGARKDVVVLFSDIRGFTTISEQLAPEELITFLNDFLGHMTRCIERHGGLVDKFIGDAVMAVFSLPEPQPGDAERALLAALAMQGELERFNRKMPAGTPPLAIGLGLHYGTVVAGLIGSPQKRSYTVIGDVVNTASRLEGMTKHLGASILVTEEIVERLDEPRRFLLRPLGRFAPKGRKSAVVLYDLMGERDSSRETVRTDEEIARVREALAAFQSRDFARAAALADALAASSDGNDRAKGYKLVAEAAREYLASPPGAEWTGEIVMHEK